MENLDCMEAAELRRFATQMTYLANYARKKARAIDLRLEGNINAALGHEKDLEDIYKKLVCAYRW